MAALQFRCILHKGHAGDCFRMALAQSVQGDCGSVGGHYSPLSSADVEADRLDEAERVEMESRYDGDDEYRTQMEGWV